MPRIPGISSEQAIRALKKIGFQVIRQGKHNRYVRWASAFDNSAAYLHQCIYNGRHCVRRRLNPGRI